jgi:hypothetical protein
MIIPQPLAAADIHLWYTCAQSATALGGRNDQRETGRLYRGRARND